MCGVVLFRTEYDEKLGDPLHGAYSAWSPIEFSLVDLMWDLELLPRSVAVAKEAGGKN